MIPDELREIFEEFVVEAQEHLESLESKLLELEREPENQELINAAFRSMHTLKGGAGFLGLTAIVETAHKAEDLLGKIKEGKLKYNHQISEALLKTVDFIKEAIKFYEDGEVVETPKNLVDELLSLQNQQPGESAKQEQTLDNLLDKYGLSYLKGKPVEDILEELVLLPPQKRPQEIVDFIDRMISGQEPPKPTTYSDIVQKVEEETAQQMLQMVEEEIIKKDLQENANEEIQETAKPKKKNKNNQSNQRRSQKRRRGKGPQNRCAKDRKSNESCWRACFR